MSELEIVISMFRREWSNMGKGIGLGALKEVAQEYNIPIKEIASTVYYKAYQRLLFDKQAYW